MSEKNQEDVEETLDLPEETKEGEEDTTDWKAEAKKLQEKAIKQRERTKELKTKLKELTPAEKKIEAKQEEKSNELDFGQLAYLKSMMDIKGSAEISLVKEYIANGKSLLDLSDNKFFKNDLAELREAQASKEAIPSGTKRSGSSSKDSVEYWTEKYNNGTSLADIPEDMQMKIFLFKN